MDEVEIGAARRLRRDGRRVAVRRMVERVYREAGGQGVDVAAPVLPGTHAAVEEDQVGSLAAPPHCHPGRERAHVISSASTILRQMPGGAWTCRGNVPIIGPADDS